MDFILYIYIPIYYKIVSSIVNKKKMAIFGLMIKLWTVILMAIATLISCSGPDKDIFAELDRAIGLQEEYDRRHSKMKDSLTGIFNSAMTDSARWEAADRLELITAYHNIDTCHHYVLHMLESCGNDPRRKSISEACYANILYKMDSLGKALEVLNRIDRTELPLKAMRRYCNAGYHIYGELSSTNPELILAREDIISYWWSKDSCDVQCAYYHHEFLKEKGLVDRYFDPWTECIIETPNDSAKANYFSAREHLNSGDIPMAIRHLAKSAECDMRLSVKAYNSLYELAGILFKEGEIVRADTYMRITLEDAYASNFRIRYDDVVRSELDIMNVLLQEQKQKKRAYLMTIISTVLLLVFAVGSLAVQSIYSSRLSKAKNKLDEVSRIKDSFLAIYMEKCVDYLNNVDKYRSTLRHTLKHDGMDAARAMLRQPSFADGEFNELLSNFDSAFLGIFPDFVEKVNSHMQEGHHLSLTPEGRMTAELRILALIRMGIYKRMKIAKVLNMSVTTVYSYHSNLKKHSLHPDSSFDRIIANL